MVSKKNKETEISQEELDELQYDEDEDEDLEEDLESEKDYSHLEEQDDDEGDDEDLEEEKNKKRTSVKQKPLKSIKTQKKQETDQEQPEEEIGDELIWQYLPKAWDGEHYYNAITGETVNKDELLRRVAHHVEVVAMNTSYLIKHLIKPKK